MSVALSGAMDAVHLTGDNSAVLPTDSQKNTVFAFAKEHGIAAIEDFGLLLARHFTRSPGGGRARAGRDPTSTAGSASRAGHCFAPDRRGGPHGAGPQGRRGRRGVGRLRARGPGRPQLDRQRVPRVRAGRVHDPGTDPRPRPRHRRDRPVAPPGNGRGLGRLLPRGPRGPPPRVRRDPQPVAPADALPDGPPGPGGAGRGSARCGCRCPTSTTSSSTSSRSAWTTTTRSTSPRTARTGFIEGAVLADDAPPAAVRLGVTARTGHPPEPRIEGPGTWTS